MDLLKVAFSLWDSWAISRFLRLWLPAMVGCFSRFPYAYAAQETHLSVCYH